MVKSRTGYSLVELVIVVAIVAVMAAVAIPRFSYNLVQRSKAEAAAYTLMTDLRLARSLAIRDAATNNEGYELDMTGSSPYSGYRIQDAHSHQVVATQTFDPAVTVTCPDSNKFNFQPLGNLKNGSGTAITVSAGGRTCAFTFVSAVGTVKCTKS